MDDGIVIFFKDEQPLNALDSIFVTDDGMSNSIRSIYKDILS